jgi:hypothetical protein
VWRIPSASTPNLQGRMTPLGPQPGMRQRRCSMASAVRLGAPRAIVAEKPPWRRGNWEGDPHPVTAPSRTLLGAHVHARWGAGQRCGEPNRRAPDPIARNVRPGYSMRQSAPVTTSSFLPSPPPSPPSSLLRLLQHPCATLPSTRHVLPPVGKIFPAFTRRMGSQEGLFSPKYFSIVPPLDMVILGSRRRAMSLRRVGRVFTKFFPEVEAVKSVGRS